MTLCIDYESVNNENHNNIIDMIFEAKSESATFLHRGVNWLQLSLHQVVLHRVAHQQSQPLH